MTDHNRREYELRIINQIRSGRQREIYDKLCEVLEGEEIAIAMTALCMLIGSLMADRCETAEEVDASVHLMAKQVRDAIYNIKRTVVTHEG